MERLNIKQKFKGLINGKVWKSGRFKLYANGLAVIIKDNSPFYVFKESVSRFTGCINASGEEIYEGDLLTFKGSGEKEIHQVVWEEGSQQWKVICPPSEDPIFGSYLENCLHSSIVGHIFTHQHLLPSTKGEVNPKKGNKLIKQ